MFAYLHLKKITNKIKIKSLSFTCLNIPRYSWVQLGARFNYTRKCKSSKLAQASLILLN